jgi:hypothetical protein
MTSDYNCFCSPSQSNQDITMPVRSLSTKEVDDLVTSDMSQLTMKERESALHDVHGIVDNDNENESPDLIATRLDELDHELNIIKRLTALETAERMSADYVRGLRLTFLRADNYDTKKAANRMKRYFEEKQGLFGEEKLTKHITLEDLDADDLATLKSGYLQVLPIKDRSGRSIIAMMAMLRTFKCVENAVRASILILHEVEARCAHHRCARTPCNPLNSTAARSLLRVSFRYGR